MAGRRGVKAVGASGGTRTLSGKAGRRAEDEDPLQAERRRLFGERVLAKRREKGLSQEGVAGLVGGTQGRVSRWELGEVTPPRDVVVRLEDELGVEPGSLLHLLGYAPLEAGTVEVSVEEAIAADPHLEEEGRRMLLAAYRAIKKKPGKG